MLYLCISETYSYITTYYMYLLQIRGELCVFVYLTLNSMKRKEY